MSIKLNSDHDETRTRITPIRSRVLYPVKLRDLVHNGLQIVYMSKNFMK